MTRLLIQKSLRESALLLAACACLLFLFCWFSVWLLCRFDLQQIEPLLKQFKPFERFIPIPLEQLLTYSGSLSMAFHEPILLLCVMVWSIARGSDVVSGEIHRGTLEMLLAQPISRLHWMACHTAVCTAGLALLCSLVWFGLASGIHTQTVRQQVESTVDVRLPLLPWAVPIRLGPSKVIHTPLSTLVDSSRFLAPTCNLFGLGFFVLGLSLFCSSCDRYRWRTLGIVIGIFIIEMLLRLLSKATDATAFLGYLTFLSAYQPDAMVHFARDNPAAAWWLFVPSGQRTLVWPHALGPLGMSVALVVGGGLWIILAAWRFRTRDIPAPL